MKKRIMIIASAILALVMILTASIFFGNKSDTKEMDSDKAIVAEESSEKEKAVDKTETSVGANEVSSQAIEVPSGPSVTEESVQPSVTEDATSQQTASAEETTSQQVATEEVARQQAAAEEAARQQAAAEEAARQQAAAEEAARQRAAAEEAAKQQSSQAGGDVQRVLDLVNAQRQANGLGTLSTNSTLQQMANARAAELVQFFSHNRPDGSSCFTIFDEYGVSYRAVGENIAYGQPTADAVMDAWMNSSGHRANILSSDYTMVGIGKYVENGTIYWVQLFMR